LPSSTCALLSGLTVSCARWNDETLYRLEMGTNWPMRAAKDLSVFWGEAHQVSAEQGI